MNYASNRKSNTWKIAFLPLFVRPNVSLNNRRFIRTMKQFKVTNTLEYMVGFYRFILLCIRILVGEKLYTSIKYSSFNRFQAYPDTKVSITYFFSVLLSTHMIDSRYIAVHCMITRCILDRFIIGLANPEIFKSRNF